MQEARNLHVSFEFFPPRTSEMEETLWRALRRLECLKPDFVSVTYGAGGSTRERTHRTVARIASETTMTPAAHLTCVGATRQEVDDVVDSYRDAGVRHIVALRGDPPAGVGARYTPHPAGYETSADLVAGIKARGNFEVSVGCYPEVHPEAVSAASDLDALKAKVDRGADRAITQFFFAADTYFRFLEKVRRAGIRIPIVPGILPISNFGSVQAFAAKTGATVPARLVRLFEGLDNDPETRQLVAASIAAELCTDLVEQGINEFHFYTLNRPELTYATCHILGVRPVVEEVCAQ